MGMNAYVLCVGAFSEKIKDCLLYGAEFYEDTKPGTIVVTHKLHCNTSEESRRLAEVLGCDAWDFNTHRVNKEEINWPALYDIGWDEKVEVGRLDKLMEAGFLCIFMPNG